MPALNIPVKVSLDDFKAKMKEASALSGTVTRQITKQIIDMNASMLASGGAAGASVLGFRAILGVLGPLGIAITATTGLFRLMSEATELAKEKIAEFADTSDKAAKANVSTDFFQRMTKSGEALKLTVDDINGALDQFAQKSQNKLGGSDLEKRIADLKEAGNFAGFTNADAVGNATGTEAKMRAVVALITEALEKGQQLAGLDIAGTAFGPKVAANLRSNNTYLQEMLANADKLSSSQIVSEEEIARAVDLKNRMEDAQKVLADRFKPIQDDLAKLGMNYHESWVTIYEDIASAVKVANELYAALKEIPDVLAKAGNSSFWAKLTDLSGKLGLNSDPASLGLFMKGQPGFADTDLAREKLNTLLSNPANVKRSMRDVIDTQTRVFGDSSKAPAAATPQDTSARDPFQTAVDNGNRRIAVVNAETSAIGQNSEARQRATLVANLEEAAKRANAAAGKDLYGVTEATNPAIKEQADRMMAAAKAAREQQTAFQGMQDALRFGGSQIVDVLDRMSQRGANFGQIMSDVFRNFGKQALEAAITGDGAFGKLFGLSGTNGGVGGLLGAIFNSASGHADGGLIQGPGTATSDSIPARLSNGEFIVRASAASRNLPMLKAMNDNRLPGFANGGLVSASRIPSLPAINGAGNAVTFAPSIAVTVQGSPGMTAADHAATGEAVGKAAMNYVRDQMGKEIRTQMRPGGILSR